ncbi:MAG: DUF262 domain-containing HNH endonuclease family protein [Chitinophagaceae bacterium]|jgi:hypothetical protein|nr:DUF262 domain-containing HNH endonuclease family protein [Chitinophagaceae bacterium]
MSSINFNTANNTYRQLVGNGLLYFVPRFQRDYSWTEVEWEDLWEDIIEMLKEPEPTHYMGYLVLQTTDNKKFDIIDGQQRLTTLSLLILAVLKCLENLVKEGVDAENNKQRQEQLRNLFIGYLDPVTLIPTTKLTLNNNNNDLYQRYLVPLLPAPKRGLKISEIALKDAFEWFYSKVLNSYRKNKDGALLAEFITKISDSLFFTVTTVSDELNAYKVFETLNAKRLKLSSTDLLKNYFFSILYKEQKGRNNEKEFHELDIRWNNLTDKLGSNDFPDFLRTFWNSRYKFVHHANLFKEIRTKIKDKAQVFSLLREMEIDVDTYVALSIPEDELWKQEQRNAVKELKMFSVKQAYPMLMAAYRKMNIEDFSGVLKICSVLSFRYNVIGGLNPNEQERVYCTVAEQVETNIITNRKEVIASLKDIYPNDEQFRSAFSEKKLKTTQGRNKRIVKYILVKIEEKISGNSLDLDSDSFNIEHILPENPEDEWNHISEQEYEQFVYRLGNLTLLEAGKNRQAGNQSFNTKKEIFQNSQFDISRKIAEDNKDWNTEKIANRQRWMAKQAISIWQIAQLN